MTDAATRDLVDVPFKETKKINVDLLKLDRGNPRLASKSACTSEECIIAQLYRSEELEELIQSIAANGYMDIEPLIILSETADQKFRGLYTIVTETTGSVNFILKIKWIDRLLQLC